MKKDWKILILIAGIIELITSVFVGLLGLIAGAAGAAAESAGSGAGAAVGGVIFLIFIIAAGLGVALFILSILIFKEENPGNGKLWTVTIIAGISLIITIFSSSIPVGSILFLVGGILLLVNNHNEKNKPITNNNELEENKNDK